MFLLVLALLELILFGRPAWRFRLPVIVILFLLLPAASGALLTSRFSILSVLFALLSFGRLFNLLRIVESRINEKHLYTTSKRTSYIFCLIQFGLLGSIAANVGTLLTFSDLLPYIMVMQLVTAVLAFLSTRRNLSKTRYQPTDQHFSDKELPTLTVAIPARNETKDLPACLESLAASDYPKLEILVLDDCSTDKTPEVIRDFAHTGVRFIKGAEPDERWLAKNQGYERLRHEASGDYILFCGVDVRFGASALRELVTALLAKNKRMVSVLPLRRRFTLLSAIVQPMRYWWELALPRRLFNRPPVLSTVWLIEKAALEQAGGFAAVSHSILPEAYFAKTLVQDDSYSFLRAGSGLDIHTEKGLQQQRDTAVRTRYPWLQKRPELALGLALCQGVLLLGPFLLLPLAIFDGSAITFAAVVSTCLLLLATHLIILRASTPGISWLAGLSFPLSLLTEVVLGLTSMVKYEFFTVEWKDRNICIPVMYAVPPTPGSE